MPTYAQYGRKTSSEWLKLGFQPLKGEVGVKRHGNEWFAPNQVVQVTKHLAHS